MNVFKLKNLFLITIFLTPLYLIRVELLSVPSNVFEILAIFSIIYFLIENLSFIKTKNIPRTLLIACALILVGILFSILYNKNYAVGFGILKSWFIIPMFFSFALYSLIESKQDIENIYKVIFVSTAVTGLTALIYKAAEIVTYDNRLTSFYLSPNHLAMYLAPGIFFGLYFLLKSFKEKSHFHFQIILNAFLLSVITVSLYFTYSYGAWLSIITSILLLTISLLPNKKRIASIIFILSLFILIATQFGTQKFTSIINNFERSSFSSRITIWQVSLRLIKEKPIIGIGPGNFQEAYLSLQSQFPPYLEWAVPQPHNIFLAFWLQAGIMGLIGFIYLLFLIFTNLILLLKNKKNAALAAPIFGFFLYTIFHGLIDTTYWKNDLAFLFWICIFLMVSLSAKHTSCKH
ncbi:MAG: O-antigen polymerase [Candidatus Moranbacteria bacterium GW2011_GWC2_37_8]|nr:MAG: O-antigen polymerase [Candidatus Moranbacteria bacterium GW2011_GWC2_37_8]KKQ60943.1 MAG: O-antigen polymerase [Parcubacteria group bacterium GW2011_GWC1_38_22]